MTFGEENCLFVSLSVVIEFSSVGIESKGVVATFRYLYIHRAINCIIWGEIERSEANSKRDYVSFINQLFR